MLTFMLITPKWIDDAHAQKAVGGFPDDPGLKPFKKVHEGRTAVDFYPLNNLDQTARLSNKVLEYPSHPVERPGPLLEVGDPFLGIGPISSGVKTPTGQILQPSFLLYGTLRTAMQSFETGKANNVEWANRLDLNGNVNLSGTERILFSMRPLDHESGKFTGYNFEPNQDEGWHDEFNPRITKLFFEGDFGEIFPRLDPTDSNTLDIGFSIGRQRLNYQDGMLMNDIVDAVGITRNSLVFDGVSNLRLTGIYAWDHVNRGNNESGNFYNRRAVDLFGLSAEADTAMDSTVSLDLFYAGDSFGEDAWFVGASATQRIGWMNSTFRVNASIPNKAKSDVVGSGVLLLSQLSSNIPNSDNLFYFNAYWNIDRFSSVARGPDQGTPISNVGILFSPVGMGRYGVPMGNDIESTVGSALGYQMFMDGIDKQLIFEAAAMTNTHLSITDKAEIGFGLRYQQVVGIRHVIRLDSFVIGQENSDLKYGLRTEWAVKF